MSEIVKFEVLFSVDSHDQDGDRYEEGVYLHFGETRVRVGIGLQGWEDFKLRIKGLDRQIKERLST